MLWRSAVAPLFLTVGLLLPSGSKALPTGGSEVSRRWYMPIPTGSGGSPPRGAAGQSSGSNTGTGTIGGLGNPATGGAGTGSHHAPAVGLSVGGNRPALAGGSVAPGPPPTRQHIGEEMHHIFPNRPIRRQPLGFAPSPFWRPWETPTRSGRL
ncbi:hypothetical protein XA68_11908 [Ophiocordyceps unilateralis]|uniref:Uncharacterized protein n=1 Tax=Ophiocordyceps unilateralis TaxID=268505 RepID=A0A2A9PFW7_OPHUN|nr:hypothetical protein XA68_11908 [Ophiocordyceps unilateralis]